MKSVVFVLMLALLCLNGCGKKPRNVDPPEGSHEVYPKRYPPPDAPGERL
jgi:hypothetical protein